MRVAAVAVALVVAGCAIAPPKPSMWQLEADCAASVQFDQIAGCTREALDANYGTAWRSAPRAAEFVDFIASTVDKQAIANFADAQSAHVQAENAARQAAVTQAALELLAQGQPVARVKLLLFGGPGHTTYLGCVNCDEYATDSVANEYGTFGSAYSITSVRNNLGQFGSQYSTYSACNPYASDPPVIVDNAGNFYGRLTVNSLNPEQIKNSNILGWLAAACVH